jgi:hypothetical protein
MASPEAGRIHVIEDTHTSYLAGHGMGWRHPRTTMAQLTGYADDLHRAWHDEVATYVELGFVHVYPGTCVLGKQEPRRGRPFLARLDAVAACRSGASTG